VLCRLRKHKEASKKDNVGDMFYAQASDSAIQQGGECGGAVTVTLKYLLENKAVDGCSR
jgi:coenzyme F420-reducing hydrogenase beta subunit